MISQTVFDTSEVLYQLGIRQVVICPGSRNAPLTLSFARHPGIECFSVIDERSAAFIALGMTLESGRPTVVCCTSGTALLNFGPAAAEAYYQEVPLIFISADRPPEWIEQRDGQTIRQFESLEPHVKKSYQLPVALEHKDAQWEYNRKLYEAVNSAQYWPQGPVHINIPFREPFYPDDDQQLAFSKVSVPHLPQAKLKEDGSSMANFLDRWQASGKRMVVLGHGIVKNGTVEQLSTLSTQCKTPVVSDIIANGHEIDQVVTGHDLFLLNRSLWSANQPSLILTIGQSLISKQLKLFLRESGVEHWHLSQGERTTDTFQTLRGVLHGSLKVLLEQLTSMPSGDAAFFDHWQHLQGQVESQLATQLGIQSFSDYLAVRSILSALPATSTVHLANSMAVRYANFFQHLVTKDRVVFQSNRGTSGIDGSNSTAVGYAINSDRLNVLLSGDVSFLYDRNAFLHGHVPENLKIIVINNFGGGIFDLIPGPRKMSDEERTRFLGTSHQRSMQSIATEEGFSYHVAHDEPSLADGLRQLFGSGRRGLLEVRTAPDKNQEVYDHIKAIMQTINLD